MYAIMLLFVYTTTRKKFVIFTCTYFKLSWNTTAQSQSMQIVEISNAVYEKFLQFDWLIAVVFQLNFKYVKLQTFCR